MPASSAVENNIAKFRFAELFATHQAFPRGEGGPPERSEDTAGRMRDGVQSDIE